MSCFHNRRIQTARLRSGEIVCARMEVANTFVTRLIGLLGRKNIPVGKGLWLSPSSGIHTFGMRFPIDVIAFSCEMKVVGLYRSLPAWRIAAVSPGTRSVLELPAGQIDASGVLVGETIEFGDAE